MKMENVLRKFLLTGVFIVPFIPLIVFGDMFFPFITGKNFAFRILIEILFGAWIVLAYRNRDYRPKKTWILNSFTIFVIIIALADFFGANPFKSFWSNFERMEGFVGLIHLFAYFIITTSVLNTEKLWKRFFNTSLFVSVIIGIYGLFQLGGALVINQGGVRVDGTFGNATYLAIYNLFHIFIAAFLVSISKKITWKRVLYGMTIILNLIILYHTASRGVILGLLGGTLLSAILIALFERKNIKVRKVAIGALVAIAIVIIGFFSVKNTAFVQGSPVLSRLATISIEGGSARFMVWNMAMQGFKEKPILGWGQENFNLVFNKYYDPGMYAQEQWFDRSHNVFFDWLIAGGLLGLLAYLSFFISVLYLLWSKIEDLSVISKSILTGLLAGYFFQNLFVFDNLISYIMFFSILGLVHNTSVDKSVFGSFSDKVRQKISNIFSGSTMDIAIAPLAVMVLISSLYYFNYKGLATNKTLIKAMSPQAEGIEKNLSLFKKAISYDSLGLQEVREQLVQTVFRISRNPEVDQNTKISFIDFAGTELLKQIDENPNDARHYIFYASFLDGFGEYDEAITYFEKAKELSPKKQQIYFGLAGSHLNKGDAAKALEIAKEAFLLDERYDEARIVYAIAAIYNNQDSLSQELLSQLPYYSVLNNDRLVQAYSVVGETDKVIEIWNERIKNDPYNQQHRLSLAGAYLADGQRQRAIQEIRGIMDINPDFKEQGQYYIDEILAGRNP